MTLRPVQPPWGKGEAMPGLRCVPNTALQPTDACIHFEPTSYVAPKDTTIDGNVLVHGTEASAVAIAGISATDPAQRIKFTNNTLQSGGVVGGATRWMSPSLATPSWPVQSVRLSHSEALVAVCASRPTR